LKVRILGCGTSTGVPKIGNHWGQCDPAEPRNNRLRSSILVESGGANVLVDCGPDLRQQLLAAGVGRLDAVIVTHDHGDHVHGIDELRPLSQVLDAPVPVYGSEETLTSLEERFAYAFAQSDFYRRIIEGRVIAAKERFGPTTVRYVVQPHGTTTSLGLRFDEAVLSATALIPRIFLLGFLLGSLYLPVEVVQVHADDPVVLARHPAQPVSVLQ
jgi:phosphoribosyl 1,2-cyclic phosphate phosphodiesterase